MELTWDEELSKVAQRWADQCQFGHDTERGVGFAIFRRSGSEFIILRMHL
jgi:hypothetical protein